MFSSVRTVVASLLCGVAVLGHAPAWVHVAGCDHGSCKVSAPVGQSCSPGCHHHHHHAASDEHDSDEHDSDVNGDSAKGDSSGHHHDSDLCVICQSLAAPTGVFWQLEVSLDSEACGELVQDLKTIKVRSNLELVPQPRGPPVAA